MLRGVPLFVSFRDSAELHAAMTLLNIRTYHIRPKRDRRPLTPCLQSQMYTPVCTSDFSEFKCVVFITYFTKLKRNLLRKKHI